MSVTEDRAGGTRTGGSVEAVRSYVESPLLVVRTVSPEDTWPEVERRHSPRRHEPRPDQPDRRRPQGGPPPTLALPPETGSGRGWERYYLRLVLGVDVVAGLCGAMLAYGVRFGDSRLAADRTYLYGLVVVPLLWVLAVAASRCYECRFFVSGSQELGRLMQAGVGLVALVSTFSYAFKFELARGYVVIALPAAFVLALLGRLSAHRQVRRRRARGEYTGNVVLVGHEWSVLELASQIRRDRGAGMRVIGACLPDGTGSRAMQKAGVPVLGTLERAAEVARSSGADTVAVTTCVQFDGAALRRLAWQLEDTAVDLVVAPGLTEVTGPRMHIRSVGSIPLIHVEKPDFEGGRRILKAALDRSASALGLLVLSPVLLLVALAVRLTSRGPVIFRQTRVGVRGAEFTVYKFRSMYCDAEDRLPELAEHNDLRGRPAVQGAGRPQGHPGRARAAPALPRRAPPADQRAQGGHVPRRPAASAALRGRALRPRRAAPAAGEARAHRAVAGQRPLRPALGGVGAPRPELRGELVVGVRPAHPVADRRRRGAGHRGLLSRVRPVSSSRRRPAGAAARRG